MCYSYVKSDVSQTQVMFGGSELRRFLFRFPVVSRKFCFLGIDRLLRFQSTHA